ncbi:hypothetical protein BpHYR1_037595 [Brachionus plicatilis]|uniref:Uncharacterized protein n=1 Tax=Brachionus plicatilis TaxID=10195 RepID=A0A3M7SCD7_BRAPC|nr:hypothetical protein BpHYR1_037595 [Brachionus plicatilis]
MCSRRGWASNQILELICYVINDEYSRDTNTNPPQFGSDKWANFIRNSNINKGEKFITGKDYIVYLLDRTWYLAGFGVSHSVNLS